MRPDVILIATPARDCHQTTRHLGAGSGEATVAADIGHESPGHGRVTLEACASGTAVVDEIDRA